MNRKYITALICFLPLFGFSQNVEILQFQEKNFDFGTISEGGGAVDHEFAFINVSDRPIQIRHVKASCGCTTPGWTRDTIPVGGSGIIKARYNPNGRPGPFNKYLTVTSVPIGPPVKLYIKGNVTPRPKTISDEFPVGMGKLRTEYRVLNMGRIKLKDTPESKSFPIYNEGDSALVFHSVEAPAHMAVEFKPDTLGPKSKGELILQYYTGIKKDYGFQNENLTFSTNEDGDEAIKSFSVYANIEEYFPPMSQEQLNAAAVLTYDRVEHDFGRVAKDSQLKTVFKVNNTGEQDLLIRKVETNCACVLANINSEKIKPGESADLEVIFNTRSRRSNQQKAITIYANSPKKPISRIIIKAYVESN